MGILSTSGAIGIWIAQEIGRKGFDLLADKVREKEQTIDELFRRSINTVSELMQERYPDFLEGNIKVFFEDKEIFNELFKLFFKNARVNQEIVKEKFGLRLMPNNFIVDFIEKLKEELMKYQEFDEIFGNNELYLSVINMRHDVKQIEEHTKLSYEKFCEIYRTLQEMNYNSFNYDKFFEMYKNSVVNNFSELNYIGLGLSRSYNNNRNYLLTDIYVRPLFDISKEDDLYDNKKLKLKQIFDSDKNIVILGEPGGGKSVLVKFIILSILHKKAEEINNKEIYEYIPFRIELRKYLAFKKNNNCNIIKYIVSMLEEEYGISNLSEQKIIEIIQEKKSIIFFDGLDEIFDIADKISVKNDIENFSINYKKTKVVTTSRIIGYNEAALNKNLFDEYIISKFNDIQVNEYINKWYRCEEKREKNRNEEIKNFNEQKHIIDKELLFNPLLLSLIVIIYRNNLELPKTKLEIYKSCTKTLVEKWDASKKLEIPLKVTEKRDSIFAYIAFWHYELMSNPSHSDIITNVLIRNKIADYVMNKKIEIDYDEAQCFAEEFLNYAEKRSLYFDNQFTHKTFLEYYTAYYIYVNYEKKNNPLERTRIIKKYINNSFWYIVLELLINLIDEDQPDSDVIDELMNELIDEGDESLLFILKVLPSLKSISDSNINKLINVAINKSLDYNLDKNTNNEDDIDKELFNYINIIYNTNKIKNVLKKQLICIGNQLKLNNDSKYKRYLCFLCELLSDQDIKELDGGILNDIKLYSIENELIFMRLYRMEPLSNKTNYMNNIKKYIELFGKYSLYKEVVCYFASSMYIPYVFRYLRNQFKGEEILTFTKNIRQLIKLGVKIEELAEAVNNSFYTGFLGVPDINLILKTVNTEKNEKLIKFLFLVTINAHIQENNSNIIIDTFCTRVSNGDEIKKLILDTNVSEREKRTKIHELLFN